MRKPRYASELIPVKLVVLRGIVLIGCDDDLARGPVFEIIAFGHADDAHVRPAPQIDDVAVDSCIPIGDQVGIRALWNDRIEPALGHVPMNPVGRIRHTDRLDDTGEYHVSALEHKEHLVAFGGVRFDGVFHDSRSGPPPQEGKDQVILFAAGVLDEVEDGFFPVDPVLRHDVGQSVRTFATRFAQSPAHAVPHLEDIFVFVVQHVDVTPDQPLLLPRPILLNQRLVRNLLCGYDPLHDAVEILDKRIVNEEEGRFLVRHRFLQVLNCSLIFKRTRGRMSKINRPCRVQADSLLLQNLYLNRCKLVRTHDTTAISMPMVASTQPADDLLTVRRTAVDDHDPRYAGFISDVNDL